MLKRFLIIFLFCSPVAYAQEHLTLEDAIDKALEHNFDIRIAKVAAQQATANNTAGNAGMLPSVYGSGALNGSSSNTHSELAAGGTQDRKDARASSYNGSLNLSWTLFDGGKMFYLKKQLDVLEKIGDLNLKAQVQATVAQVIQYYAQSVWQQQQLIAIDTGIGLAKVRMDLSKAKFDIGTGVKTDYLQAKVDYNARRSDSLNQMAALNNSFGNLNLLMGVDEMATWVVDDSLPVDVTLVPEDKDRIKEINFGLAAARENVEVSKLNAKIQKSYMLPSLTANGAYNYSRSTSQTGFALFTRSYGPSGSLNLNVPVFMGGNYRRQYKVASLQAFRDELLYEKQNTDLGRQYRTAWGNYGVSVSAYKLETENIKDARENLNIQRARFRVGVATTLEARQAESDYVTALLRLYTAIYNVKLNETVVLQLENGLVK
ncbi:TolC family protein [Chitinophagaceae bacterium MMS25-I14]